MMTVTRQVVGYDPTTERVAFEIPIPLDKWEHIRPLVKPNDDDPDYIYAYPLDAGVAKDIMGIMGERVSQSLKYFLECEAE